MDTSDVSSTHEDGQAATPTTTSSNDRHRRHDSMVVDMDTDSTATQDDERSSVQKPSLAKKETQVVTVFRIVLFSVLLALTIAVSVTALALTRREEQEEFEASFQANALKVSH